MAAPAVADSVKDSPPLGAHAWMYLALWMVLGYAMILFNKTLFSTWDFAYPYFIATWHCVFSTIATQILSKTTDLLPGVKEGKVTLFVFVRNILPLSTFFAFGLVCGNIAYKYLSVSFIQMLKSMTPVPLLLVAFLTGRERWSILQLFIVLIICLGVTVSSAGELNFSAIGFSLQVAAVLSDVGRVTVLESFLVDFKLDSLSTLYYISPTSAVLIGLGFCVMEAHHFPIERLDPSFCLVLFVNAAMAFSLNIAIVLAVTNTSGMIMSIAGLIKDILVVISSMLVFKSPVTRMQVVGYSLSLFGMSLYRNFKKDPITMQNDFKEIGEQLRDIFTCRGTASICSLCSMLKSLGYCWGCVAMEGGLRLITNGYCGLAACLDMRSKKSLGMVGLGGKASDKDLSFSGIGIGTGNDGENRIEGGTHKMNESEQDRLLGIETELDEESDVGFDRANPLQRYNPDNFNPML